MMPVYDALYQWAMNVEDQTVEHHNWMPKEIGR